MRKRKRDHKVRLSVTIAQSWVDRFDLRNRIETEGSLGDVLVSALHAQECLKSMGPSIVLVGKALIALDHLENPSVEAAHAFLCEAVRGLSGLPYEVRLTDEQLRLEYSRRSRDQNAKGFV